MCVCIIPARFNSRRLPGKVLRMAGGKTMLEHCYDRAVESNAFDEIYVATENVQIAEVARGFGALVVETGPAGNGTERAAITARKLSLMESRIVILQADYPMIHPEDLKTLTLHGGHEMKTLAWKTSNVVKSQCADNVKVAIGKNDLAFYFSRHPIPYGAESWLIHVGVYSYPATQLARYLDHGPTVIESQERLEQLRTLHLGIPVRVIPARGTPQGVDTMADFNEWAITLGA